ncbi:hypothetical protein BD410DRAFT_794217 [Rickenella mellea]|uniref:F-box domain-containing protein n=1 Tax=Rickenella mellea TaxID=50990 RepID=A0A4Y7PR85_9AGAM|nr:hypothetical protein BD410DRAFT_794217 [Rickenella mellea]
MSLDAETTECELSSEVLEAFRPSALNSLSLRNFVLVWDVPNFHNLSTLSLQFDAGVIWVSSLDTMLRQCPMLENLTIGSFYLMDDELSGATVALCHLRRLTLKVYKITAFESLLSVLDLPLDVQFTLFLHPDTFNNRSHPHMLPLPRHLASTSVCHKLECYCGLGRVKVEAFISPNTESRSVTQVSIRIGPVVYLDDDETKWADVSSDIGDVLNHDCMGVGNLANIRPGFFVAAETSELTRLFRGMHSVPTVSISLSDAGATLSSILMLKMVSELSSLRDLRIQMELRSENLNTLRRSLLMRAASTCPPIQRLSIVGGETLSAEKRLELARLVSVVIFEE